MVKQKKEHISDFSSTSYFVDLLQLKKIWNEVKSCWVFEDIDLGTDQIEKLYYEHRLKTIRANWRFILLILQTIFLGIAICFLLQEDASTSEKLGPIVLFALLFTSKVAAMYGAILVIGAFGLVLTRINLEFTHFRLYEGFLCHISASFLLSTCLISDWRSSSAAIIMVYTNLYVMLRVYYDYVPITILYAILTSSLIFCFNAFLVSRNLKQEFLSAYQAEQASCQMKKILEVLPEGVTIMNEQGDDLKFINKKLMKTLDVQSFYQPRSEHIQLAKTKKEIDQCLEKIYHKNTTNSCNSDDSIILHENVFNNFVVRVQKNRVEEGKGADPDVQINQYEDIGLSYFLQNERELCQDRHENERAIKVSIKYKNKDLPVEIESINRSFVVKTSKIDVVNDLETCPTFLQMFIDTTQITQLEEAKAQSNYQRQMLSNVSHEFRTPLNAMSLSLYLMKDHLTEDWAKYHKIASSSCDILKGLVEDILDFSKIEAGVFEVQESEFTFKQLFDEVNSIFEMQTCMKRINLNFTMDDAFCELKVKSDKERLKQILLNLLSNSLKFTDEGSINVGLKIQQMKAFNAQQIESDNDDEAKLSSVEAFDEMPVCNLLLVTNNYEFKSHKSKFDEPALGFARQDKTTGKLMQKEADQSMPSDFTKELRLELSVRDTGIGIPEGDLPSLFKLFGKTSSNHNRNKTGTGLGLTICKKLCEKLGGKIVLESKEGIGTKVTCTFRCFY
ncbi:unnamed protein product [Moneuplotes crassus]|uniref:histidine kinase n=1 Tax=Euplotes crassus TaxID=5936 RepID=A0AAD1Y4X8_EUPCR|nr:unnamed protein product [Moneuplotes crassus]